MARPMQIDVQTTPLANCKQYNKARVGDLYSDTQWFTKEIMRYVKHYKKQKTKKQCYEWLQTANCDCWKEAYALRYIQAVQSIIIQQQYNPAVLGQFKKRVLANIQNVHQIAKSNTNNNVNNNNNNASNKANYNSNASDINANNNIIDAMTIPDKSESAMKRQAAKIAPILFEQANFNTILGILDILSSYSILQKYLQGFKIGECVSAMIEMQQSYESMSLKKDIESVKQKQIMLGSITIVESDKSDSNKDNDKLCIKNKSLISNITNTDYYNARLMKTLLNIKKEFKQNISCSLFSRASLHNYPDRVNHEITDYIKQYYHENTYPSPSPYQQVYTYDNGGNRIKHPKHYLYSSMKEFYNNFVTDTYAKQLFTRLQCNPPSLTYFVQQKPSYVKKAHQCEFNLCTHHENFLLKWKCFCNIIQSNCHCGTNRCSNTDINIETNDNNNDNNSNNYQCNCNQCNACSIKRGTITPTIHDILQATLCPFNKSPHLDCLSGNCASNQCGIPKLKSIFHSCHTCTITRDTICEYHQWETAKLEARNNKTFKYTSKVLKHEKWQQFMRNLEESYMQFIVHQTATINQHGTRKILTTNDCNNNISPVLNDNSLFCSIDYISNLCIKSRSNPISTFTSQRQIAFCELFEIIKQNNNLIKQSHCFLSGDPKHDWQMSSHIIQKYIHNRKLYFQNQLHRELKICFFYSDRSPKEFSTTPLLNELIEITKKTGVIIVWNFTAPQHGKWLHDAEGSVIKRVYIDGIMADILTFESGIPFETSIVNYLKSYFAKNTATVKRNFYEIHVGDVEHKNNTCQTLPGITKLFSFRTTLDNSTNNRYNTLYGRPFSCTCSHCMSSQWDQCVNINNCGPWAKARIAQKKQQIDVNRINQANQNSIPNQDVNMNISNVRVANKIHHNNGNMINDNVQYPYNNPFGDL